MEIYKNILYIQHKGSNIGFLQKILKLNNVEIISLTSFIDKNIDLNKIILYQTWPDDRIFENGNIRKPILDNEKYNELNGKNHHKFPKELVEKADIKFLKLKNKIKILVDLYDDSDLDAFSRFLDNHYPFDSTELKNIVDNINSEMPNYFKEIPRIKNTPSINYKEKFNVILDCTYETYYIKFLSDEELLKDRT